MTHYNDQWRIVLLTYCYCVVAIIDYCWNDTLQCCIIVIWLTASQQWRVWRIIIDSIGNVVYYQLKFIVTIIMWYSEACNCVCYCYLLWLLILLMSVMVIKDWLVTYWWPVVLLTNNPNIDQWWQCGGIIEAMDSQWQYNYIINLIIQLLYYSVFWCWRMTSSIGLLLTNVGGQRTMTLLHSNGKKMTDPYCITMCIVLTDCDSGRIQADWLCIIDWLFTNIRIGSSIHGREMTGCYSVMTVGVWAIDDVVTDEIGNDLILFRFF